MKTLFLIAAVFFIVYAIDAAPRPKPTPKPVQKSRIVASKTFQRSVPKANYNGIARLDRTHKVVVPRQVTLKLSKKQKRQFLDMFNGGSVYPNYYVQHPSPFAPFQNAFLRAVFQPGANVADFNSLLKQANLTDANGKPLPLEARTGAAFETAFGDRNATNITTSIFSFDHLGNVNIINPFLAAKDFDGKLLQADNGLPGVKTGKEHNGKSISLVNPYHGSALDPVFGPEIAPRYEIHYTPQEFRPIATPLSGAALNSRTGFNGATFHDAGFNGAGFGGAGFGGAGFGGAGFGGAGFGGAGFGGAGFNGLGVGGYEFGLHPSFHNAAFGPYPLPFIPGFDPKSLKSNGKGNGNGNGHDANKPDSGSSTETSAGETTSESFPESSSESNSESSNSETSSESSTDSSL